MNMKIVSYELEWHGITKFGGFTIETEGDASIGEMERLTQPIFEELKNQGVNFKITNVNKTETTSAPPFKSTEIPHIQTIEKLKGSLQPNLQAIFKST